MRQPEIEARALLDEAWHKTPDGLYAVPVDPYSIARSLGIDVLAAPLTDDVSGMLVKQAGRDPHIYVSSDDADVRQRFTCAHEIGHYLLRSSGDADDDFGYVDLRGPTASRGSEPHEIFANQFGLPRSCRERT